MGAPLLIAGRRGPARARYNRAATGRRAGGRDQSLLYRDTRGQALSELDELMLELAAGARRVASADLGHILDHIAQAGFDPTRLETARGDIAGLTWQGRVLRGSDRIPPLGRHYLRHVVKRQEWPAGTSVEDYVQSIQQVIRDPTSGVFTSRFGVEWQIGIVRESGTLCGPGGADWVLVEYRVALGHWMTAHQFPGGLEYLELRPRREIRWLRRVR